MRSRSPSTSRLPFQLQLQLKLTVIDPLSYIVIIICKTLQHVIGCLLVWMIFAMAIGRK